MSTLLTALAWAKKIPIWGWLTLALMIGALCWHNARVDAAVAANAAELKAEFEQQKQQAINDESARSRAIVAQTKEQYDAQINTIKNDAASMLDNHRTGTVRLSVPVVADSCSLSATGTGAGSSDGAARADIQPAASDDLVALAADADAVVRQLNACQAVVISDRAATD